MIIPMLCVTIFVILVVWFLLPRRSEERFSRNAETDLVCRLLLEKKNLLSCLNRPRCNTARSRSSFTFRACWRRGTASRNPRIPHTASPKDWRFFFARGPYDHADRRQDFPYR